MKHRLTSLIIVLVTACTMAAQTTVTGIVTDGKERLVGANVFILGTIDGCLTDSLGRFSFQTSKTGEATLKVTYIGYEDYTRSEDVGKMAHLAIQMKEQAVTINEVVVTASTFSFGKSDHFKTMDALDVVLAGNSCGDIVAAMQTLPGTQKVGEDGKLYVRGGESEECQTFVNGMHVLMPYTTSTENSAVRGRFSPFLFKGINFSLGGYGGEYGQALSAVLPMEATDQATSDKYGVSASLVDWNIGGTKTFTNSSLSFNAALTSTGLYDRLFTQRFDFTHPYRKWSGEAQYKREYDTSGVLKSYVGYDLTTVGQHVDGRHLSLREHNVYANVTRQVSFSHGCSLFVGVANSSVFSDIDDALAVGDHYHNFRNEVHLKAEVRKACSDVLKMSAGVEDYIRNSRMRYDAYRYRLDYNILATHVDAQWRVIPRLFLNMSARAEMMQHDWLLMPRATLSYIPCKRLQVSLVAGRYSQDVGSKHCRPRHPLHAVQDSFHAPAHRALLEEIPPSAPVGRPHLPASRAWSKPRRRCVSGKQHLPASDNHAGLFLQRQQTTLPRLFTAVHARLRLAPQPEGYRQIRDGQVHTGLGGVIRQRTTFPPRQDTTLQQCGCQPHLPGESQGHRLHLAEQRPGAHQYLPLRHDGTPRHSLPRPFLLYRNICFT